MRAVHWFLMYALAWTWANRYVAPEVLGDTSDSGPVSGLTLRVGGLRRILSADGHGYR